jgi:DNA topoisomerase-3
MELILCINNELLKSAEMTGNWEYKLRQIEKGEYQADAFLQEMKQMVSDLVMQVKNESGKRIAVESAETKTKAKPAQAAECPKCKSGTMLKGKSAFGCSNFKNGCDFKIPFDLLEKRLTDSQILALAEKGKTSVIKGFLMGGVKKDGILKLTDSFNIEFEEKDAAPAKAKKEDGPLVCPKCRSGNIMKGNSAYGCSNWKSGCSVRFPFELMGKQFTETHLQALIRKGETAEIKGFVKEGKKVNGKLKLNGNFELEII